MGNLIDRGNIPLKSICFVAIVKVTTVDPLEYHFHHNTICYINGTDFVDVNFIRYKSVDDPDILDGSLCAEYHILLFEDDERVVSIFEAMSIMRDKYKEYQEAGIERSKIKAVEYKV